MSLAVVVGQCVRLGLWDSGLDLGCLLLRLYPDTDPWGLPCQPMRTQVVAGIGNTGNGPSHTANPPGCWFRCKLSLRSPGVGRDWRGRIMDHYGCFTLTAVCIRCGDFVITFRESRILPCTPCGQRGPHLWRGVGCSLFPILVCLADTSFCIITKITNEKGQTRWSWCLSYLLFWIRKPAGDSHCSSCLWWNLLLPGLDLRLLYIW